MKKDILMIAAGLLLGWIFSIWTNQPGKYQVVDITNPLKPINQNYLLNTRTGQIQQLVYGGTGNLYWAPPEARSEKEYNKMYLK